MPSDRSAPTAPLEEVVSITPNDTTTFPPTRAIYIETTGDVTVDMKRIGTNVTIPGLVGGIWHPMAVTRVYDTGTTPTTVLLGR